MPPPELQPSVQPQVGPGGQLPLGASPTAFGAPVAGAIQDFGQVAQEKHREARRIANQTMALAQDNETSAWLQSRLRDPKTGLLNQLAQLHRCHRGLFSRFEHDCVSRSQRRRQFPGRHQQRKIPGNDLSGNT